MLEITGAFFSGLMLEQGDLSAVLWFGAGIGIGAILAVATLAACALESLTQRRVP